MAMRSIGRLGKTRFLGLFAILAVASLPLAGATRERSPVSAGALLLLGGGEVTPEIARRFVALAGGRGRHFVYIPTAAPDAEISPPELKMWFRMTFGVDNVTILHTRDRSLADTDSFAAPLETADGVWFGGGRQWRIADAYLGTRVEAALHAVLRRGGIVAGTSAGASILASYLVRGAPEGNWILSAPGHERGFGLLPRAAVDQHVDRFHRENDIASILRLHPDLLGIGLDESTAITVINDSCTVIGNGRVILHDGKQHDGLPYAILHEGDRFSVAPTVVAAAGSPMPMHP
jgi:cyanophycinase